MHVGYDEDNDESLQEDVIFFKNLDEVIDFIQNIAHESLIVCHTRVFHQCWIGCKTRNVFTTILVVLSNFLDASAV